MKLGTQIRRDLNRIGLKTDFELDIRGYSKRLEGTYNPNTSTLVIYAREEDGMLRDYKEILEIAIHEAVHHLQWKHDSTFVRKRGVMHNASFHRNYNKYIKIAREEIMEVMNDTNNAESMGEDYRLFI